MIQDLGNTNLPELNSEIQNHKQKIEAHTNELKKLTKQYVALKTKKVYFLLQIQLYKRKVEFQAAAIKSLTQQYNVMKTKRFKMLLQTQQRAYEQKVCVLNNLLQKNNEFIHKYKLQIELHQAIIDDSNEAIRKLSCFQKSFFNPALLRANATRTK